MNTLLLTILFDCLLGICFLAFCGLEQGKDFHGPVVHRQRFYGVYFHPPPSQGTSPKMCCLVRASLFQPKFGALASVL